MYAQKEHGEIVVYQAEDGSTRVDVRLLRLGIELGPPLERIPANGGKFIFFVDTGAIYEVRRGMPWQYQSTLCVIAL